MKKIPQFTSEHEEQEFWAKADSTEYLDWSKSKNLVLPNLKPNQLKKYLFGYQRA